ncbi:hypothetical protein ISF_05752 [Cordyceps fumosorosea ARSEF 2679]|uniref:Tyrosine specific protein phosphatases domain-containing protein n=1 Tax=Cordyceps fumosorosea (strain ARSEF 2679) TaxID=1081104 RepID=A0A167TL70_CORFA|nr:hypothetical protein ISF_05752 [Cordyceps fumosorosea ARSEF 2679]OAA60713.1 hypothetical protein ISF_05752 [Cordyceps fumosorosea ARSEF 2679]
MGLDSDTIDKLVHTDVRDVIPKEDLNKFEASGLFECLNILNLRDAGKVPGSRIPEGRVFRSGALPHDDKSVDWISKNADCVVDLRRRDGSEGPKDPIIDGIKGICEDTLPGDYEKIALENFTSEEDAAASWRDHYMDIARRYSPAFRATLEYIRDYRGKRLLIHCLLGRDRTSVLLGLLHHLAGSNPEAARRDYMLSRIGCEFKRCMVFKSAMVMVGITDPDTPGFDNLIQLRRAYWDAFVEALSEKFGGWDGYATSRDGLNFSKEDLEKIKDNLTAPPSNRDGDAPSRDGLNLSEDDIKKAWDDLDSSEEGAKKIWDLNLSCPRKT